MVLFNPAFVALVGGDHGTAILLSQLVYWFTPAKNGKSKLTIEKDGKLWLAKSRKALQEECGLSDWGLRKALVTLQELGFLESEVHLFGGKTMPHLHLHIDRVMCLSQPVGRGVSDPVGRPPSDPVGRGASDPIGKTTTKTTNKITVALRAEPIAEDINKPVERNNVVQLVKIEGKMATASEILKNLRERDKYPHQIGVGALAILWKKRMGTIYEGFQKQLTGKELGQLKLFLTKVGDPDTAYEALDFALQHWGEFVFEAKTAKGLSTAPEKPVVGFVLQYYDVVVQLIAQQVPGTVAKSEVGSIFSPQPPSAEQTHDPTEDVVSKEQVMDALAKLKKAKSG